MICDWSCRGSRIIYSIYSLFRKHFVVGARRYRMDWEETVMIADYCFDWREFLAVWNVVIKQWYGMAFQQKGFLIDGKAIFSFSMTVFVKSDSKVQIKFLLEIFKKIFQAVTACWLLLIMWSWDVHFIDHDIGKIRISSFDQSGWKVGHLTNQVDRLESVTCWLVDSKNIYFLFGHNLFILVGQLL